MATNYYDDDEDNDTTTDVVGQLRKVNYSGFVSHADQR